MKIFDVVQYILIEESKNNRTISNLRLQKYLYFCQFISLGVYGIELFDDEFEAWEYGPCIPKIYTRFKAYGSIGIIVLGDGNSKYVPDALGYKYDFEYPNEHDRFVIDKAIRFCDKFTDNELVDICRNHKCWDLAIHGAYIKSRIMSNGNLVYIIPVNAIENEVKSLDEVGLSWYNIKEEQNEYKVKCKKRKTKRRTHTTRFMDKLRRI